MRALALSGGGFRATLFHLGVVRSLVENGKLKDVEVICSVSGGSILAGHLLLNWKQYNQVETFDAAAQSLIGFVNGNVRDRVFRKWLFFRLIFPTLAFIAFVWAFALPAFHWQIVGASAYLLTLFLIWDPIWNPRRSRVDLLIAEYEQGLYGKNTATQEKPCSLRTVTVRWGVFCGSFLVFLAAFVFRDRREIPFLFASALYLLGIGLAVWLAPRKQLGRLLRDLMRTEEHCPKLYILSTSLSTGDVCGFSDDGFHLWSEERGHRHYGAGSVSISAAVAASSAFPPAFPPYRLEKNDLGTDDEQFPRVMLLTDGGVYDNSGIEGILRHYGASPEDADKGIVVVSNAERKFEQIDEYLWLYRWLVTRSIRANDIIMRRVGIYQFEAAYAKSLPLPVRLEDPLNEQNLRGDLQKRVRNIRTDLNKFTFAEIQLLVYYGYLRACLTDSFDMATHPVPPQPVAGFGSTLKDMPYAESDDKWLPYKGDKMQPIDPRLELEKSGSNRLFKSLLPLLPVFLLLVAMPFSAWGVYHWCSVPGSLSFDSVFTETSDKPIERTIIDEINRNESLKDYKLSLLDEKEVRYLFFATSKPLGEFVGERKLRTFNCKIVCKQKDCVMKVRLYLRREEPKVVYQMLPSSEPFHFEVPEARPSDRLIAIGTLNEKHGHLSKIVELEVVK